MAASYAAGEILEALDLAAGRFEFPLLENQNVDMASVRLSAYRDEQRWAILIEVLGDNPAAGAGSIHTSVYGWGNCLKLENPLYSEAGLIFSADVGPTLEVRTGALRTDADWLLVRGRRVAIDVRPESLRKQGIHCRFPEPTTFELLLSLLGEHRQELLASEGELRRIVPEDVPLFLRLDAWSHPRANEFPGQSETFVQLARALAEGDPTLYAPGVEPDTGWENWIQK